MIETLTFIEVWTESKQDIIKAIFNEINKELYRLRNTYIGANRLQIKSEFNLYYFHVPVMYMNILYGFYKAFIYK